MSSCTRTSGGLCGAVRSLVQDADPAPRLSNVFVRLAAAARPVPKTLTALVGAEPLIQAQAAEVQRLQFFLSEAAWDAEAINVRRLALLAAEPATSASAVGVLIIDDTGNRKDGSATDRVARQYLGSVGQNRQRHRRGDHVVGRRGALLPAARSAVHAGRAIA